MTAGTAALRAAARPTRRGRKKSKPRDEKRDGAERTLFGVPERFMRPRLILLATVAILVGFGVLMVYSASSVTALNDTGDSAYYLKRQLGFVAIGTIAAVVLAKVDYRLWVKRLMLPIWVFTVLLLILVLVVGTDNDMGANRWINLGFFDLQPSEFAKITVIFTAANLAQRYFEEGSLDWATFLKLLIVGVAAPLVLIVAQPDKGTTMVIALTLLVMGYLAGMPKLLLLGLFVAGAVAFVFLSVSDAYSFQRLKTMLDPWSDRYDTGWQLVQGFYAFGTGGLFGVGVGFSRQKYAYLPMAHNDFIFAVIGEECGLVGTLGVLAGFAVLLWAGYQIARHAPDLSGRLLAAGCTSIVLIQLLLNVSGVLGVFPLSGKPIPFLSYGGSSILASLMLVGLIASVSIHSKLPETVHDGARKSLRSVDGGTGGRGGLSFVGEVIPRSEGGRTGDLAREGSGGLHVVEGGGKTRKNTRGRGGRRGKAPASSSGSRRRVDLGPNATERLRGRNGSGSRGRR